MIICIMMSIWCQNLWDELILKNEINILKQKYWETTKFKVFTYDKNNIFFKDKNIEYINYFPIWIKNIKNIFFNLKNLVIFLKTIIESDLIVIWWWWIFFDNEVWNYSNPLNQWLFRTKICQFLKKQIIFWAVSLDVKQEKNFKKIKNIFWSTKEIYVRDIQSKNFLNDNFNYSATIIKDPVFYDNWEYDENKNFMLSKIDVNNFKLNYLDDYSFKNKKIWIAFRSWYLKNEDYFIKELLNYIIEKWWKLILLCHSFHQFDKKINDYLFLEKYKYWNIEITKTMEETYLYYKNKKIDFCISMRLHSVILSQVYGIPFINLKYAKKSDII